MLCCATARLEGSVYMRKELLIPLSKGLQMMVRRVRDAEGETLPWLTSLQLRDLGHWLLQSESCQVEGRFHLKTLVLWSLI